MLQHLLDKYRYAPEKDIWLFRRRVEKVDINVAVWMEDGEVEQVEAWKRDRVDEFMWENEVVVRYDAPREARKAAISERLNDLL